MSSSSLSSSSLSSLPLHPHCLPCPFLGVGFWRYGLDTYLPTYLSQWSMTACTCTCTCTRASSPTTSILHMQQVHPCLMMVTKTIAPCQPSHAGAEDRLKDATLSVGHVPSNGNPKLHQSLNLPVEPFSTEWKLDLSNPFMRSFFSLDKIRAPTPPRYLATYVKSQAYFQAPHLVTFLEEHFHRNNDDIATGTTSPQEPHRHTPLLQGDPCQTFSRRN